MRLIINQIGILTIKNLEFNTIKMLKFNKHKSDFRQAKSGFPNANKPSSWICSRSPKQKNIFRLDPLVNFSSGKEAKSSSARSIVK